MNKKPKLPRGWSMINVAPLYPANKTGKRIFFLKNSHGKTMLRTFKLSDVRSFLRQHA